MPQSPGLSPRLGYISCRFDSCLFTNTRSQAWQTVKIGRSLNHSAITSRDFLNFVDGIRCTKNEISQINTWLYIDYLPSPLASKEGFLAEWLTPMVHPILTAFRLCPFGTKLGTPNEHDSFVNLTTVDQLPAANYHFTQSPLFAVPTKSLWLLNDDTVALQLPRNMKKKCSDIHSIRPCCWCVVSRSPPPTSSRCAHDFRWES